MKINVLDAKVYNRISAGEVVERPASIVKELVENSIDAGAKNIKIEITDGGIKNITVSDDGCGIEKYDLVTAFLPHATSKIKDVEDLDKIASLGFRGEALASISSVCQVKLSSKTPDSEVGYMLKVSGGNFEKVIQVARANGTTLSCDNIFFNTPVRAKFLKRPKIEEGEVTNIVEKFMLSHSEISFQYFVDGKQIYNTHASTLEDIIFTIYGKEIYDNLVKVDYQEDGFKISGFVTKPKVSKNNRTYQTLFVNGRFVENYLISSAVQSVFESFLMKGRFPFYVLSLSLPLDNVDVNVHPSKREVKFDNSNKIFGLFRRGIEKALLSVDQIQSFLSSGEDEEETFVSQEKIFNFTPIQSGEGKSFSQNATEKFEEVDVLSDEKVVAPPKIDFAKELEKVTLKNNSFEENISLKFSQTGAISQPKVEEDKFLKASVKDEMKILGTIFKTYIVIELDDAIYFIDQHAAHERLLYDRLVKSVDEHNVLKQDLLWPYEFNVGAAEIQRVDALVEDLAKIGFDIAKIGDKYAVKAVPLLLSNINLENFVGEILKDGIGWDRKASDYIHSKLCQSACKHAIKGGDEIDKDECAYIIEQVRKGVMLCPHGRPITLIITKHEFEKMFKRVL